MSANLDLLRALAVLMVLAQHLLRRAELLSVGPIPVETIGHFGVLLFFVQTFFTRPESPRTMRRGSRVLHSMQCKGKSNQRLDRISAIRENILDFLIFLLLYYLRPKIIWTWNFASSGVHPVICKNLFTTMAMKK